MFFISHRGNISGPNKKDENKFEYIKNTLNLGFDVEIDIWHYKNNFYLGHDEPIFKVNKSNYYLDVVKFNILANNTNRKIVALGGINFNNLKKN